jgi:DNA-binding NarL/FixJ family response regulator
MNEGRSVLVVSSDRLHREATTAYLERRGWQVTSTADALQGLVAMARSTPTAVLVLDSAGRNFPRAMVLQMRRRFPDVPVIILGGLSVPGARTLPRTASGPQVIDALSSAPGPSPESGPDALGVDRQGIELLTGLTQQERRILSYITAGLTKTEIARRMGVSEHTVRTHQQNLHHKLGVHSKLELLQFASTYGLLGSDEVDRVL